ncbi:phage pro-head protease, partial [Salmonella enterica subsp. enterica serovar Heidelberg str. N653]
MSEREIRCYSGEVRAETHDSEPSPDQSGMVRSLT